MYFLSPAHCNFLNLTLLTLSNQILDFFAVILCKYIYVHKLRLKSSAQLLGQLAVYCLCILFFLHRYQIKRQVGTVGKVGEVVKVGKSGKVGKVGKVEKVGKVG